MGVFILPDLGEGLPDASIRKWYVNTGDYVAIDQPLVAVETAKAVVDIPSPFAGKILTLKGSAGDVINVGDAIIEFSSQEETHHNAKAPKDDMSHSIVGNLQTTTIQTTSSLTGIQPEKISKSSIQAVPAARLIAREFNIDLHTAAAQSKNNIITVDDIKRIILNSKPSAAATPPPTIASVNSTLTPLTQAQRAMAQIMTKSHREITAASLMQEADLHAWADKTDITVRLLQAISAALKVEPILNAYYYHDQFSYQMNEKVNIGIALDTLKGLYMPVVKDASALTAAALREKINGFKIKSKNNAFSPEDLQGATIMLSNYGSIIGQYATPTLVPPMVTIIGAGKIYKKVVAADDQMEVHRVLPLSITIDHRLITGGQVARFFQVLVQTLETA
jgi:2-oxoisovalerate dehydrogenase E2 component (dihydrolipoyl transacylase)